MKKMGEEVQASKQLMKKAQLHAEEVQGTFDTHNGEYIRMKVYFWMHAVCFVSPKCRAE